MSVVSCSIASKTNHSEQRLSLKCTRLCWRMDEQWPWKCSTEKSRLGRLLTWPPWRSVLLLNETFIQNWLQLWILGQLLFMWFVVGACEDCSKDISQLPAVVVSWGDEKELAAWARLCAWRQKLRASVTDMLWRFLSQGNVVPLLNSAWSDVVGCGTTSCFLLFRCLKYIGTLRLSVC